MGTSSTRSVHPAFATAANFSISRSRPSEMSPQQRPNPFRRRPSSSCGSSCTARCSRSATAAAPSGPVTATDQPGVASERARGFVSVRPTTVIERTAGPSIELMSPPTITDPVLSARAAMPSYRPVRASTVQLLGIASDVSAHDGVAPFAARSPSASARDRQPASRGLIHAKSKCTPSTNMSQLATTNPSRSGKTAASS